MDIKRKEKKKKELFYTQEAENWGLSGSRTRDLSHPKRESYH